MMPLRYIYTMALEQDIKNSVTSRKTAELLQNRCYQVWKSTHTYWIVINRLWFKVFSHDCVLNSVSLSQRPWLPRRTRSTSGAESLRSSGQENKRGWYGGRNLVYDISQNSSSRILEGEWFTRLRQTHECFFLCAFPLTFSEWFSGIFEKGSSPILPALWWARKGQSNLC